VWRCVGGAVVGVAGGGRRCVGGGSRCGRGWEAVLQGVGAGVKIIQKVGVFSRTRRDPHTLRSVRTHEEKSQTGTDSAVRVYAINRHMSHIDIDWYAALLLSFPLIVLELRLSLFYIQVELLPLLTWI
jgi:hypothetical protein